MFESVGIIPAAGKAQRFGGIHKELLPLKSSSLVEEAIARVEHTDAVVLVTNTDKIRNHAQLLGDRVTYLVQSMGGDIWGAILTAIRAMPAKRYYFTMPDTYMPRESLRKPPTGDFGMWTFQTNTPERFGCIVDGFVRNKETGLQTPALAWGALTWTDAVRDLWLEREIPTYTDAFNLALGAFPSGTAKLGFYHDVSCLMDYLELLEW